MHKTKGADNVNGQFRDTSSQTGTQGTVVDADWLNTVQNELVNLLEDNNVTLNDNDNGQIAALLHNVLRGMFAQVLMSAVDPGSSESIVNELDGLGMLLHDTDNDVVTNFSAYGARVNHLDNNVRWTCEIHRDHIVFEKKQHATGQTEGQETVLRSISIDLNNELSVDGFFLTMLPEGLVVNKKYNGAMVQVARLDATGFATAGHADVSNGEVICKGLRCVQSTILDKWTSFLKTSSNVNLATSLSGTTSDEAQFEAGHRIVVFNESGDNSINVTLNAVGTSETLEAGHAAEFICLGVVNHNALFVKL